MMRVMRGIGLAQLLPNPRRTSPAIENCVDQSGLALNAIVNREWKALRKQAVVLFVVSRMDPRVENQGINIRE